MLTSWIRVHKISTAGDPPAGGLGYPSSEISELHAFSGVRLLKVQGGICRRIGAKLEGKMIGNLPMRTPQGRIYLLTSCCISRTVKANPSGKRIAKIYWKVFNPSLLYPRLKKNIGSTFYLRGLFIIVFTQDLKNYHSRFTYSSAWIQLETFVNLGWKLSWVKTFINRPLSVKGPL